MPEEPMTFMLFGLVVVSSGLGADDGSRGDGAINLARLLVGLPVALVAVVVGAAFVWPVARAVLVGVELTPTHLVARGYFVTRSYPRSSIMSADVREVRSWQSVVLRAAMNREVTHTLALTLEPGVERTLYAANSYEHDVDIGADTVRAWLASGPGSHSEDEKVTR